MAMKSGVWALTSLKLTSAPASTSARMQSECPPAKRRVEGGGVGEYDEVSGGDGDSEDGGGRAVVER